MRALVVGGSGGIGAAFASLLAADARFGHVTMWSRSAADLAGHRTSARRIDLRNEATIAAAAQELGAVDLVLIATGIAFVKRGRSYSPFRLVLGWTLVGISLLGLLHIVRGPDKISADVDELETAGGWLGALVAEPLSAALAAPGAVVIFIALLIDPLYSQVANRKASAFANVL